MTEATNVWVRTASLMKAVTGKATKGIHRGLSSGGADEVVEWDWTYATLKQQNDQFIEIFVQDQDSPHHGLTVKLPPDCLSCGDLLHGRKYRDEEDFDDGNDEDLNYPDDLITLTHLHEPEVVHCLRKRYAYDKIYTSTGPILLALNPFKNCKHLYNNEVMAEYWARGELFSKGIIDDRNPLPPHVYGIADRSFRNMMHTLQENKAGRVKKDPGKFALSDQSILVSGESGAGKTVTTKFIMQYLATLSQRSNGADVTKPANGTQTIEQQVLQSNPILESFGNARTIRNDNSSRFGKFIEIKFNKGALVGASIETYLLEKVRLISQAQGERNYHIFYELFSMDDDVLEEFHLGSCNPEDFNMTNRSGTFDRRDGVEDFETFDELKKAMQILGLSDAIRHNIFTIPAAAMHASNVTFRAKSSEESELDDTNPHLVPFLKLMGLSKQALETAVCYLQIKAGKEYHMRTLSTAKAQKGLEALIKAFYGALFTLLVGQINSSITVHDSGSRRRPGASSSNPDEATIGVLDIFGFESFKHNSFEQLCINYCNEALQQQFNQFVLKNEQAEYDREGVVWTFISFPDNQDVLDLIDKKGCGILSILDDHCRAPGTTDKTFSIDLYRNCAENPRFQSDFHQVAAQKFGLNHYAGPVEYDTKGFVAKNKDEFPKEATDLLFGSTKELVRELASILSNPSDVTPSRPGATSVKVTVGSQFSKQLRDLRAKIDLTAPHYVRCLKPNDLLLPDHFNPLIISDQLRYAGVIEAVRVSRVGYPHRFNHNAFTARYHILALSALKKAERTPKRAKDIDVVVNALALDVWRYQRENEKNEHSDEAEVQEHNREEPPDLISVGFQVGKTKVFIRRHAFDVIERLRSVKNAQSAVFIQKQGRGYVCRRVYFQIRRGIIALQCAARTKVAKAFVNELRLNHRSTLIQKIFRKSFDRKRYLAARALAKWMQRIERGREARRLYETLNRNRKAITVQRFWRGYFMERQFHRLKCSAVTIQCGARRRLARRTVKSLRLQARDLTLAVTERDKLRMEAKLLRNQLIDAQSTLASLVAQASSTIPVEELETANSQIKQLLFDSAAMQRELEDLRIQVGEQNRQLDTAEGVAKESTLTAESYMAQFLDYSDQLQQLKEKEAENEREVQDLRSRLEVQENVKTEWSASEKMRKLLENDLSKAQNELAEVKRAANEVSNDLRRVEQEHDLVVSELQASLCNKELAFAENATAELEEAKELNRHLEKQLEEARSQYVSNELNSSRPDYGEIEFIDKTLQDELTSASYGEAGSANSPTLGLLTTQQQNLMDESGKMLEYLRKEVFKLRNQNSQLRTDFDLLKENNQRLMDANASAGASFAALNQHAKQLNKQNSKLSAEMSRSKQLLQKASLAQVEAKEELKMKQASYVAEVHSRLQYQKTMAKIVDTIQARCKDTRLVEDILQMADDCEEIYMNGPTSMAESTSILGQLTPTSDGLHDSASSIVSRFKSFLGSP